jgi:hypothetical protein
MSNLEEEKEKKSMRYLQSNFDAMTITRYYNKTELLCMKWSAIVLRILQ